MVVNNLELLFFRNYNSFSSSFSPGINFIYGRNGQGKTNLIESLYLLTHLKSFRTAHIDELESFGKDYSFIRSKLTKQGISHDIEVGLQKNQKRVFLDGKKVAYSSDYIKNFFSILFSPDQLVFFKEYPLERRNFFDRILVLLDQQYFKYVKDFNKIKKQKGSLLRQGIRNEVSVWNKLLAGLIPKISNARSNLVQKINVQLSDIFKRLTQRNEHLEIHFQSDMEKRTNLDETCVFSFLEEKAESEIEKGVLIYGPHKDRFWMTLAGKDDKTSFSQGEFRIAFLALQFGVNQLIKETLGFNPIILLDDISSELDRSVIRESIDFINHLDNQVFITSTEIPVDLHCKGNAYLIDEGKLVKEHLLTQ